MTTEEKERKEREEEERKERRRKERLSRRSLIDDMSPGAMEPAVGIQTHVESSSDWLRRKGAEADRRFKPIDRNNTVLDHIGNTTATVRDPVTGLRKQIRAGKLRASEIMRAAGEPLDPGQTPDSYVAAATQAYKRAEALDNASADLIAGLSRQKRRSSTAAARLAHLDYLAQQSGMERQTGDSMMRGGAEVYSADMRAAEEQQRRQDAGIKEAAQEAQNAAEKRQAELDKEQRAKEEVWRQEGRKLEVRDGKLVPAKTKEGHDEYVPGPTGDVVDGMKGRRDVYGKHHYDAPAEEDPKVPEPQKRFESLVTKEYEAILEETGETVPDEKVPELMERARRRALDRYAITRGVKLDHAKYEYRIGKDGQLEKRAR